MTNWSETSRAPAWRILWAGVRAGEKPKNERGHQRIAFHVADGDEADHGFAQHYGDEPLDEHAAVHHDGVEGETLVHVPDVFEEAA